MKRTHLNYMNLFTIFYIIFNIKLMIRGTSHQQDSRFKDKTQKMLLESNWPEKYDIKIDLPKVTLVLVQIDLESLKVWVEKRTTQLLGYEDDIVSGTALSIL